MNFGFWETIKKPFFVLAPMADVTDAAFRRVIAKYGKPDVTWTEFVSADGLILAHEEGKKKLLRDLLYSESERPIVAQLFGSNPETMRKAATLVQELGFDGLDINMGCPDRGIEKQGAGAAMIKNPKRAREIIRAAKEGAPNLPISVKTRVGYNKVELETWLPELLAEEPALITIHARTRKEMSAVPARWEHVKRAVEIRNELGKQTLIAGNGDVLDLADAREKIKQTGADGVMLGRAIFGNPWLFSDLNVNIHRLEDSAPPSKEDRLNYRSVVISETVFNNQSIDEGRSPFEGSGRRPRDVEEKLTVMLEHTKLFVDLLGDIKNFAIMKKHYKAYVKDFDGAAELRNKLMEAKDYAEIEHLVLTFVESQKKA